MSTKALREALKERSHLRGLLGLPPDDGGDALKEVEAIERAAKVVKQCEIRYPVSNDGASGAQWCDATITMASIAENAP